MSPLSIVSFILIALSSVSCQRNDRPGRPSYIHCQSNLECEPGFCCSIGPMRYSIPDCRPMQEEGSVCRPASAGTINMTAAYPDGASVLLTDVHYILCPCADGLTCNTKEGGVCRSTGERQDANRLTDENNNRDEE